MHEHDPAWVVNLAAVSSVGRSWQEPNLTRAVNATAVAAMVGALAGRDTGFIQASSIEEAHGESPYADSKREARATVQAARDEGLRAVVVTFANHESPLRPLQFVTRKITRAAAEIALGRRDRLELGNLAVRRDWGFAGDYAHALALIIGRDEPVADLEIATGRSHSLLDLLEVSFSAAGIDQVDRYVHQDAGLLRPSDAEESVGDPTIATQALGWEQTMSFEQVIEHMVRTDIRRLETGVEESVDYLYP